MGRGSKAKTKNSECLAGNHARLFLLPLSMGDNSVCSVDRERVARESDSLARDFGGGDSAGARHRSSGQMRRRNEREDEE